MSLRRTSCAACKAAKRRCDQSLPACWRCAKKELACVYPYPSVMTAAEQRGPQVPPRQPALATPDALDLGEMTSIFPSDLSGFGCLGGLDHLNPPSGSSGLLDADDGIGALWNGVAAADSNGSSQHHMNLFLDNSSSNTYNNDSFFASADYDLPGPPTFPLDFPPAVDERQTEEQAQDGDVEATAAAGASASAALPTHSSSAAAMWSGPGPCERQQQRDRSLRRWQRQRQHNHNHSHSHSYSDHYQLRAGGIWPGARRPTRVRSSSSDGSPGLPRSLSVAQMWPRRLEVETWRYCARELIAFVGSFATTAASPFILHPERPATAPMPQPPAPDIRLHPSLQKALGVCSAYCTLTQPSRRFFFHQYLESEVAQLVSSSSRMGSAQRAHRAHPRTHSQQEQHHDLVAGFRDDLARAQAMTLYQIMGVFSDSAEQRQKAQAREALLASWTRELMLRIKMLTLQAKAAAAAAAAACTGADAEPRPDEAEEADEAEHSERTERQRERLGKTTERMNGNHDHDHASPSRPPSPWTARCGLPLYQEEVVSAYRTVLASCLLRCVYSILAYQQCPLLAELSRLPIYLPSMTTAEWKPHHPPQPQSQPQSQPQPQHTPGQASDDQAAELWARVRDSAETKGLLNPENQTIPYTHLGDLWAKQTRSQTAEGCDRFTTLLLVACRGCSIVNGTRPENRASSTMPMCRA